MSMLGQLLQSFTSARRHDAAQSNSDPAAEDIHTLKLLFPQTPGQDGFEKTPATIDLDYPRDVRILIAQEDSGALHKILFDSKIPPHTDASRTKTPIKGKAAIPVAGAPRHHARAPSVSVIPENAERQRSSDFGGFSGSFAHRARQRKASMSSLPDDPLRTKPREQDEIVDIAKRVMFENTASSLKVTSNKIHIVPMEKQPQDLSIYSSSLGSELSSTHLSNRPISTFARRPSALSQSFIPGEDRLQSSGSDTRRNPVEKRRRTVLITRTFSMTWTDNVNSIALEEPTVMASSTQARRLSTSTAALSSTQNIEGPHKMTHRSPMYAITLLLQLPVASKESPPSSRQGSVAWRNAQKPQYASLGSSWGSDTRSTSGMTDPMLSRDALLSQTIQSDVDDRVDLIGQHWDVITRALTELQAVVQDKILDLLKAVSNRHINKLAAGVLDEDVSTRKLVDRACLRIVRGLKVVRVQVGQGEWTVWRDEVRWIRQWLGGRNDRDFFYKLLTAFLGSHLEWLEALAPPEDKHQFREQRRRHPVDDSIIPSRTIIISPDKMAARRLVYLLSAFLPNRRAISTVEPLMWQPHSPSVTQLFSSSPTHHATLSQQHSLRRQINRSSKNNDFGTNSDLPKGQAAFVTAATDESISGHHGRRGSDARSILGAHSLYGDMDPIARKGSATTSPTISDFSIPIPQFAYAGQASVARHPRRRLDSSGSRASVNLTSALHRTSSNHSSSDGTSRWDSFRSMWSMSGRRESTTDYSDILQTPDEGWSGSATRRSGQTLRRMVEEAELCRRDSGEQFRLELGERTETPPTPDLDPQTPVFDSPQPPIESPIETGLKMSVNEADGVIDVEIPFVQWGSPLRSPLLHDFHSDSSQADDSMQSSLVFQDTRGADQQPLNVAGWLQKIHPDFVLQASRPYADVLAEVRKAMRAEATPVEALFREPSNESQRWIKICTTLIADTQDFTVKRFQLSRLVQVDAEQRPLENDAFPPFTKTSLQVPGLSETASEPYMYTIKRVIEEKFEEDVVSAFDPTLSEAIEKMTSSMSRTGNTADESTASSRPNSIRRRPQAPRRPTLESLGIDINRQYGQDHTVAGAQDASSKNEADDTAGSTTTYIAPTRSRRQECKQTILGALRECIAGVAKDRTEPPSQPHDADRSFNTRPGSILEEGITSWYAGLYPSGMDSAMEGSSLSKLDRPAASAPISTPRMVGRDNAGIERGEMEGMDSI